MINESFSPKILPQEFCFNTEKTKRKKLKQPTNPLPQTHKV